MHLINQKLIIVDKNHILKPGMAPLHKMIVHSLVGNVKHFSDGNPASAK